MVTYTAESTAVSLSDAELAALAALQNRPQAKIPVGLDFLPTSERIQEEIRGMLSGTLSPYLGGWVERYARVGKRNPYLWKWCRQAVEVSTLPCVASKYRARVNDVKTLGVMLDVMLDDLADRNGRAELLDALLDLPLGRSATDLPPCTDAERSYAAFTCDLWREISNRCRAWPRYGEFARLLKFDYLQLSNVMRYSHLLNESPELLNLVEHDLYTPHNMHIMICATVDLMCSPTFDRAELGRLREVVSHAQWMGRIGNLVTTWQRELGEKDFTSGVYARAVMRGDVTLAQLLEGDHPTIEAAIAAGRNEEYFLRRWKRHREFLLSKRARLCSFDVREYLAGFDRLICLHLGSRGCK